MSYQVFARKFRPQTFDEVIAQEPIVTTLKNSIAKNRIAQSFLFTGSRGVGKTSTARIFAKALNCENGPTPTPCNRCSICEEITEGTSLDILEIDGASNRGIDEIRTLREGVKFKPARGRYKIYIIDEVHMLTGEAFNALLKTLEEPPEHVKFIFATTEVHKVPLTILSRCQRFNFRRIPTDLIMQKLKEEAKKEKIKVQDEALFLIAKHSEGSLRDGESLLDQLASFGDGEVSSEDVAFTLGLTGDDVYFSLLEALEKRDGKKVLGTVGKMIEGGKDLVQFSRGLLAIFRDLLVSKVGKSIEEFVEGTAERIAGIEKFQQAFSHEELLFSVTLLQQLLREIRWSNTPRFLIEACLLKMTNRSDLRSIDEILKELKKLEAASHPEPPRPPRGAEDKAAKNPGRGPSVQAQGPKGPGAATGPALKSGFFGLRPRNDDEGWPQDDITKQDALVQQSRKKKENLTGQILGETASMVQHEPADESSGDRTSSGQTADFKTTKKTTISTPSPSPLLLFRRRTDPSSAKPRRIGGEGKDDPTTCSFAAERQTRLCQGTSGARAGGRGEGAVTLTEVGRVWPDLLERVKAVKMSCGTFLAEAEPVDVVDGIVVFGLPSEFKFHQESLEKQDNKELVRLTLSSLLGRSLGVSFVVTDPVTVVSVKKPEPVSPDPKGAEIISSALDIFEGSKIIQLE